MYAGTDAHRDQIIRRDFNVLQSLSQGVSPNRNLSNGTQPVVSSENLNKLNQRREQNLKYGRVLPRALKNTGADV